MKKLIFLATMIFTTISFAQDSEVKKLSTLVELGSSNKEKRDSILVEIKNMIETTESSFIKVYANKAYLTLKELSDVEKNVVYSKQLSELSKEDLKNIRTNHDKFRELTFIHFKKEGRFAPYLSIKKGILNLRLSADYSGEDWVFFDKVILLTKDKKHTIFFSDTEREVGKGYVYESGDILGTPEIISILRELSQYDEIEIRYSGKRNKDRKLSKNEILGIQEIISLYDKLKK